WLLRRRQIDDGFSQGWNLRYYGPEHLPRFGLQERGFLHFQKLPLKERVNAQFRVEFFNVFNHPNIANPFGSVNNYGGGSDPGSSPSTFGCGCTTPVIAAGNPIIGSGSSRDIQLGLKLTF